MTFSQALVGLGSVGLRLAGADKPIADPHVTFTHLFAPILKATSPQPLSAAMYMEGFEGRTDIDVCANACLPHLFFFTAEPIARPPR